MIIDEEKNKTREKKTMINIKLDKQIEKLEDIDNEKKIFLNIELEELIKTLENIDNEKKIVEQKNIFVKKHIAPLYEQLKTAKDKKTFGQNLNSIKLEIEQIVESRINKISSSVDQDLDGDFNANIDLQIYPMGTNHILNITINEIINYLQGYNFELVTGNEITTDKYNFDALNIDKNHPAREMHDSLFINANYLLRTHCTTVSALYLNRNKTEKDIRVFSYGNVYRRDEDDATHSHQFMQVDFVWLKNGLSLANLKYIINGLIKHLFGQTLNVRYRLSYFPFTEPSFEVDVECWRCESKGCSLCKATGWIEILGAGMLNQNVIEYADINHTKTAIAAGIGVERIAMLKYGIEDIRDLYNNDFDINSQFRG